jgi:hypothetical protein
MIEDALVFGANRFQVGVLIQPSAAHVFDLRDLEKLAKFRNDIWFVYLICFWILVDDGCRETVEGANRHAPSHSRIFKEVIPYRYRL